MRKSSNASIPICDGARPPTVALTCARAGRFSRQLAGIRTATPRFRSWAHPPGIAAPAAGSSATAIAPRPHRPCAFNQPQSSAARWIGTNSDSRPLPISRAGVFLQRFAERHVLGLGRSRKPCRVGRQERERRNLVAPVLGEIEMDAPDQVPGWMSAFQERLHGEPCIRQFHIKRCIHDAPEIGQNVRRQIFCTRHGRNSCRDMASSPSAGTATGGFVDRSPISERGAQRGDVTSSELSPIRQRRRQRRPHFIGAQAQQPMSGPPQEGFCQPGIRSSDTSPGASSVSLRTSRPRGVRTGASIMIGAFLRLALDGDAGLENVCTSHAGNKGTLRGRGYLTVSK